MSCHTNSRIVGEDPFNPFRHLRSSVGYKDLARVEARLARLERSGEMSRLPPVSTFQSVVDATVIADDVVRRLYSRVTTAESELVLFDVNRASWLRHFVRPALEDLHDAVGGDVLPALDLTGHRPADLERVDALVLAEPEVGDGGVVGEIAAAGLELAHLPAAVRQRDDDPRADAEAVAARELSWRSDDLRRRIAELERMIGRLAMELEMSKKVSRFLNSE